MKGTTMQTLIEDEGGVAPGARTEIPHAGTNGHLRGGWTRVPAGTCRPMERRAHVGASF